MEKKGKCLYYNEICIAPFKCFNQKNGRECKQNGIIPHRLMYLDKLDKNIGDQQKFKIPF